MDSQMLNDNQTLRVLLLWNLPLQRERAHLLPTAWECNMQHALMAMLAVQGKFVLPHARTALSADRAEMRPSWQLHFRQAGLATWYHCTGL